MLRAGPSLQYRRQCAIGVDMTRTGAVTKFADGVPDIRIFVLLVRIPFVIVSVATRTVRLKCGVLPGHLLRIRLVTGRARQIAAMILRLIRKRSVPVVSRYPRIRCVADVALYCGAEVILVLADCLNAIVAGRTRAKHLCVVDCEYRRKHIGGVTVFTDVRCLNVRRVLTNCIGAVMAADTVADNIDVIEIRR